MAPRELAQVIVVLWVACLSEPTPQVPHADQKLQQAVSGGSERPERAASDPAEQLARDRLAELTAREPGETLAVAEALDAVADLVWRDRRYPTAELVVLAERAVAIRGRLEPHALATAHSLSRLADFLERRGNWDRAKPFLDRSFAIRKEALPPDELEVADSLKDLSYWYGEMDQYDTALDYVSRALDIRARKLGPDHPLIAEALVGLGRVHWYLGDYEAAESEIHRAIAIRQRQKPPDGRALGGAFRVLANMEAENGDYASARTHFEQGLAVLNRTIGANRSVTAIGETMYAAFLSDLGERVEARRLYEHALSTFEKLGVDNSHKGRALLYLGGLLQRNRDYERARACYERALPIFEKQIGPEHVMVAECLRQLGSLCFELGDNARAGELIRRALEIEEKLRGPDHRDVADVLVGLADIMAAGGDHAAALTQLQRARAIYEKKFSPSHPGVGGILRSMASRRASLGELGAARSLAAQSCTILERTLGEEHPDFAASLAELARIDWWSGDANRALEGSLRAQAIVRAHIQRTAQALSEREALRYRSAADDGLGVALTVLASRPKSEPDVRRVWDEVVRSRALVLDEMAARHRRVLNAGSPASTELAGALEAARGRLACLVVNGARGLRLTDYREKFRASQEEVERLERRLGDESAAFRESRSASGIGLAEVLNALPAGTALVAYVRFEQLSPVTASRATPDASYLALIASGGRLFAVPLGQAASLEALVKSFREEASTAPADAAATRRYRDAAGALRRAIWDPVVPRLAGTPRVFVVPDADLSLVPFETLPTVNDRYLLDDGPEIFYLSAERDLARPLDELRPGRGLLAVGGPDFDAGSPPSASAPAPPSRSGALRFQPLPSALAEIEDVRASWPSADVAVLSGGNADEASFKRLAPGRSVIHIATHGFFAADRPDGSASQLRDLGPDAVWENPLLLSGLAFAGANRIDQSLPDDGDDGILTAEEIASLDLRGVESVVLSSCQSGVGPTQTGEGVLGLQRAFEIAGARTLVVSLWPVGDHETREWIRGLYAARTSGLSTAAAVRRASLDILERRRRAGVTTHPFSWGAFIAAGGP